MDIIINRGRLHAKFEAKILNGVARRAFMEIKIYKITPCASATAIGGTICSDIVGYNASKGICGVTGGSFIFFCRKIYVS